MKERVEEALALVIESARRAEPALTRQFIGEIVQGDVIATRQLGSPPLMLMWWEVLSRQMEWMLKGMDGSCAMWIEGALNYHGPRD